MNMLTHLEEGVFKFEEDIQPKATTSYYQTTARVDSALLVELIREVEGGDLIG